MLKRFFIRTSHIQKKTGKRSKKMVCSLTIK
nr:MAG TPA: hypothetical protein [Caudoviricetes sp.]